jgi:precorrin-6B methylase 2
MAIVNLAHNQVLVDATHSPAGPLLLEVGTGAGSVVIEVKNTGGAAVFARLNDATNQTNWARIKPESDGYMTLNTSSPTTLEVYKADEPRFINIRSDRTPDQVFASLEIKRHV